MESAPASRQMWAVRWLYFFFFANFGIFMTFGNVYFREIGLSGAEIGLINSVAPLMGMVSGPLWGVLSDRFRNPRLFLGIAVLGGTAAVLSISLTTTLAGITLTLAAYWLFISACVPLIDTITLGLLGGNRERYGRQRVWGSLGYIAGSWLFGFILQQSGLHVLFYGCAAGMLLILPGLAALDLRQAQPTGQAAPWAGLAQFIRQPTWLLFALSLIVIGIVNNALNNFLGIYIRDLNGGEALIGSSAALGVLTELPVMYFSAYFLRRLGNRGMIALGFVFFGVRMLLYGLIPAPGWVLAIALMHGFTYAPYWVGSVSYVSEMAPENLKATAQGMLSFIVSLSSVIGSPINGGLYDWLGAARLFLVNGVLAVAALVILRVGAKRQPQKSAPTIR